MVTDYKANRAAMPDDLAEQINWVHRPAKRRGPDRHRAGYEADDVIGTMALRALQEGFDVTVVSIDKDFFQLVRPGLRVTPARGRGRVREEGVVRSSA